MYPFVFVYLTIPPAVEFGLQLLDGAFQALVLLLLLLVFLLPLLGRQLQVDRHRVLDGLGSKRFADRAERGLFGSEQVILNPSSTHTPTVPE